MKKTLFTIFFISLFSELFSQVILLHDLNPHMLTARSLGLGNASAPLVNDASALMINPAGLSGIRNFNVVFSGEAALRSAKLKDNGGVPNLSRSDVLEVQPAYALNQAALAIPLIPAIREAKSLDNGYGDKVSGGAYGSPLVLALGYARQGGNLNFKEKWDVLLRSGSSSLRDLYTWNHYGNTQIISAGLSTGIVKKYKSSFSMGFAFNQIFGSRYSEFSQTTFQNGNQTSSSSNWQDNSYKGTMLNWGVTFTTRQAAPFGYYRTARIYSDYFDDFYYQYFDSVKSCLIVSLSGNTPYTRENTTDYSTGIGKVVSETRKPGTLSIAIAWRQITRQYAIRDNHSDDYNIAGVHHNSVTPVLQFDMMNLDHNRVYIPSGLAEDSSLNGMRSNRLSLGLEFWSSESQLYTRLGYSMQQYARKNSSFVTNPGKQMVTHSLCAGIGGTGFDLGLRMEFFKHQRVIYWNGGTSGLDYRGTVFHLIATFKLFQKPEPLELIH